MEGYKHLENRPYKKCNTWLYRKGRSRLSFLRKQRSFNLWSKMVHIFYHSIASAIFLTVRCRGSSIQACDSEQLEKWIKKAGSVLGLGPLQLVVQRRRLHTLLHILENISHPLNGKWGFIYIVLLSKALYSVNWHSPIHAHILAQGHHDTQLGGARDRTSNLAGCWFLLHPELIPPTQHTGKTTCPLQWPPTRSLSRLQGHSQEELPSRVAVHNAHCNLIWI